MTAPSLAPVPRPPRGARQLLRVLLHRDDREPALSDLDEEFEHRHEHDGHQAAARWYRLQVLRSIGPAVRRRWVGRRGGLPLSNEFRWAWRAVRGRGFGAAIYIALVAIAVGGSTLAFSAADAFVFQRAPYPNAGRLVLFERTMPAGVYSLLTRDERDELARRPDLFRSLHGHVEMGPVILSVRGISETVWVEEVTPSLFDALGVLPTQGRPLIPADGRPGAAPVVLIAGGLARQMFGRAEAALDQLISISSPSRGDHRLRVVGVMPMNFGFPHKNVQLWRPLGDENPGSAARALRTLGLLAPSASFSTVEQAMAAREATVTRRGGIGPIRAIPIIRANQDPYPHTRVSAFTASSAPSLFTLLFGAALCLTIIAGLNLVSLELASSLARAHIHAVQTALGAAQGVLLRTILLEGLILTVTGALTGYAAAVWGASAVRTALPRALDIVLLNQIDVDPRATLFMTGVAFAAWLLASGPLAWHASRSSLTSALRRAAHAATVSRAHIRWRHGIVAGQVTMTVLLLSGAVLFLDTYAARTAADSSFDRAGLVVIDILQPSTPLRSPGDLDRDVVDHLRTRPGVLALARASSPIPLRVRSQTPSHLWIEGATSPAGRLDLAMTSVSPEFFDALGIRLLLGRSLASGDSPERVVIDEAFAKRFWPGANALGVRFSTGDADAPGKTLREIIGIASHVRVGRGTSGDDAFAYYTRLSPEHTHLSYFVLRLDSISRLGEVTQVMRTLAPDSVIRAKSVDDEYADIDGDARISAAVTATFGTLAFIIAVAGIYGVTAFVVAGRTREIGIRLALGAAGSDIRRSIFRPTMRVVGVGIVTGISGSLLAFRWIESQPIGVAGSGPATYVGVAIAVAVAALLATLRPTLRASRINPAITLRAE